jgi:hypothetical protein
VLQQQAFGSACPQAPTLHSVQRVEFDHAETEQFGTTSTTCNITICSGMQTCLGQWEGGLGGSEPSPQRARKRICMVLLQKKAAAFGDGSE